MLMRIALPLLILLLVCIPSIIQAQDTTSVFGKIVNFPNKIFNRINNKTADLNKQLTRQTEKYLNKLARKEEKLKRQLYKYDSNAAKNFMPGDPQQQYMAMVQKLKTDTSKNARYMGAEYQANLDTLQTTLAFLTKNPQALNLPNISNLPGSSLVANSPAGAALQQLQQLQAKMQDADYIKQFIQQRKAQMQQYLMQYAHLPPGITNIFQHYKKDQLYFTQQLRAYQEELDEPDKMMSTALVLLNKLPAFAAFMQKNSFLSSLFGVSPDYGTTAGLEGLQTRDQIVAMIQNMVGQGGPNAASTIQSSLQSASQEISKIRDKISALGAGNGNMDMPDFKPNPQKTKTFLQRLEYGTNLQTTHGSFYFPTTTDLGLSIAYMIAAKNDIGIGASYKIGWGSDISHIHLTSQGAGLRSFIDIQAKKSFFVTGGFEYNYQPPTIPYLDISGISNWQKSGLIGLSKIVTMNSKVFKKTKVSILWDFLSYQQIPKTQPILFRVAYSF